IRGIFHAAMVLQDKPVGDLTTEDFDKVLAPKVAGAWNLHQQTVNDPLDLFVMFSSVSALLGSPMQGNYAAANAFLDELALLRRASGRPALSVNWGALAEIGYVARHPQAKQYLEQCGLPAITPHEALDALDRLLRQDAARGVVVRMDFSRLLLAYPAASSARFAEIRNNSKETETAVTTETIVRSIRNLPASARREFLENHLAQRIAKVLGASAAKIDSAKVLTELGLDSLMAVELQSVA